MFDEVTNEADIFEREVDKLKHIDTDRLVARKYEGTISSREYAMYEARNVVSEISKCELVGSVGVFGSITDEDTEFPKDIDVVIFVKPEAAKIFYDKYERLDLLPEFLNGECPSELEPLQITVNKAKASTTHKGLSERDTSIILLPEGLDALDASILVQTYVSRKFLSGVLSKCVMFDKTRGEFDKESYPPVNNDIWDYLR